MKAKAVRDGSCFRIETHKSNINYDGDKAFIRLDKQDVDGLAFVLESLLIEHDMTQEQADAEHGAIEYKNEKEL